MTRRLPGSAHKHVLIAWIAIHSKYEIVVLPLTHETAAGHYGPAPRGQFERDGTRIARAAQQFETSLAEGISPRDSRVELGVSAAERHMPRQTHSPRSFGSARPAPVDVLPGAREGREIEYDQILKRVAEEGEIGAHAAPEPFAKDARLETVCFLRPQRRIAGEERFARKIFDERRFLDAARGANTEERFLGQPERHGSARREFRAEGAALFDAGAPCQKNARRKRELLMQEDAVIMPGDVALGDDSGLPLVFIPENQPAAMMGERSLVRRVRAIGDRETGTWKQRHAFLVQRRSRIRGGGGGVHQPHQVDAR